VNEEDGKNKLIVPWLTNNHVPYGEIYFERPFNVKLGLHTLAVGDEPTSSKSVTARLDILVTRQGLNLLLRLRLSI
jgi:hypothetical protein